MFSLFAIFGLMLVIALFNLERRFSAAIFLLAVISIATFLGYTLIHEVSILTSVVESNLNK